MRVGVRVDAGPLIGGGHAMRCLTLADTLAARGAQVTFVCAAMPDDLVNRIKESGHKHVRIRGVTGLNRDGGRWHERPLDDAAQAADTRETGSAVGPVDWMIVDHYLLDARWHSAARSFADRVLVIDDLANRPYDCDLLVDQTFGHTAADYENLIPPDVDVLAGGSHALLRPEFEQKRHSALARRREPASVPRILISMGTTDIGGSTARIVDAVIASAPDCDVDVILGEQAPSLPYVRQVAASEPRINIHIDSHEMAVLMRNADLAVGGAGTTTWERCCLGLPAIAVVLAENQRPGATALAEAGAVRSVETADDVGPALGELLRDLRSLSQMSAAAFAITDGRGTQRVAAAILGDTGSKAGAVELRPATPDDAEVLWLWRNDPITRAQSRNTDPITWKSHVRWLSAALADAERRIMVAERDGVSVGTVGLHAIEGV